MLAIQDGEHSHKTRFDIQDKFLLDMIGVFSSGMIALKLSWKIVRTHFMIDMYIFVTQISYPTRHMTCAQDSLQYYTRQISYGPTRYFFGRDSYFDYNRISSDY